MSSIRSDGTVTAATEARARAAFEDYFGIDGDASTVSATRDGNEWTITYNAAANNEYSVTRRPGQTLTAQDINCMREIFYSADRFEAQGYVLGEVYVVPSLWTTSPMTAMCPGTLSWISTSKSRQTVLTSTATRTATG